MKNKLFSSYFYFENVKCCYRFGKLYTLSKELEKLIFQINKFKDFADFSIDIPKVKAKLIKFSHYKKIKNQFDFILKTYNPKNCKKATGKLREYQLKVLDFAKEIYQLFQKEGIQLWIDGGTLLGAVRHKGFIPWDDDIDFTILRSEFEKIKIYLSNHYHKIDLSGVCSWTDYENILKVTKEKFKNKPFWVQSPICMRLYKDGLSNVFVDFFAYDYYNDTDTVEILQKKILSFIEDKKNCKSFSEIFALYDREKKTKNLIVQKSTKLSFGIDNMGFYTASFRNLTEKDIFPLQTIKFENFNFKAPANIDIHLKTLYGKNYMKLPKDAGLQKHS